MDPPTHPALAQSLAAALDWWREAGVDLAYHDDPQAWLKADEAIPEHDAPAEAAPPAPPARIGGDKAQWPRDLEMFREWWLAEPSLDFGGYGPRLAPRGPAGAPLLILVPMPEAEDEETLLAGPHGRLVAGMAQAMGLAPGQIAVAAALTRHVAVPDWRTLAESGLGDVLRHLLALSSPQRLLVLGRDVLPLLGHDPAQGSPPAGQITIHGSPLPVLAGYAPGRLLEHPRLRAELWRRWLEWTDDATQ